MEMNIHLAQSIQARNELKRIANVKFQIIGVKDSNPIIGCQQDALSGAFLMTQKDVRIKGGDAANILCNTSSKTKFDLDMDKEYTGHEIFTKIIPAGINNVKKNDKGEINFQIKDGNLLTGLLDKSSLSVSKNSIIHFIWDKYGPNKSRQFIDDAQKLILNYLLSRGLTISFKDAFLESKFEEQIKKLLDNTVLENKYNLTQYENDVDQISPLIIEASLYSQMNAIGSDVGATIKKNLNASNLFWSLVTSGAKGSETNLQQMMACIGQQALEGRRIQKKVEGRSLIYFHKDDDTPEARGFTRSSLLDGLKGYEAFIFTAAGREGLIDTAIKSVTWETPIVIIENNEPKYTEIGKWIDNLLENNPRKIKHYTDRQMELLDTENIFIPTTDENGVVTWGAVSAITRHDPGTQLYEIKTSGGRKVTVTESKSLLIWDKTTKKLKEMLTPDIKVGDSVPATETLCEPPIIMQNIDVSKYLSKKEYIYGTDFHKAVELMNASMEDRFAVPKGWWERNNGTNFTLPYTKKASLQRCIVRSKDLKANYVFPYGGNRNDILFPEKFPLNNENGIFIGLFLAEGNVSGDSIRITNTNENIKIFVRNWFDKHNINWDEENRINKIGGNTCSIRGHCSVLANFLTKLLGSGAEHKYVPSEAFISSEQFIVGLLNGYFSGDGCITKNSIDASSASERLIEGISMLCSRIGVFCKIYKTILKSNNLGTKNILPSYHIRISAQWARQFSQKVTLIEENKDKKMKAKKWCNKHHNFDTYNNVVLDEITEINLVDVKDHQKVYDLTIPSTLNFGLANGLQVRDTASTGYLQRKLIKGLEDLSIKYDGTNRNSRGVVIQYVYGENGINQACQTEIKLNIMDMDNKKLEATFNFTDEQIKKIEKKHKISAKEMKAFNTAYINKMMKYRDEMRNIQMKALLNFKTMEEKFMLPVNLFRLTQDYSNKTENLELKPQYIIDSIEEFLNLPETKLLPIATKGNDRLKQDDRSLKYILEMALYEYLSPNKCIFDYGLNKEKLTKIWDEIKNSFIKGIAEPGEMVGILAAQSIGEPTTQLNLNTKHFAGVSSKSGAVSGVPRILELLSFSKDIKTPQISVYFDNKIRSDKNAINRIASYFKYLSIKQLIDSAEIYYNPINSTQKKLSNDNVSTPFFVNNQKAELSSLPFVFRLKMNIEKMLDKETTLLDIKTKFVSFWYKHFTNIKTMKRNEKDIFSKISRCAILSNSTADKEQIIHIRFSISTFNYQILVDFLNIVLDDITLKGIDGINDIDLKEERVLNFDKDTGATLVEKEFVVITNGINLEKIKYMKGINNTRVLINDIFTIYRHYGIEATRQILMSEYMKVLGDKLNNTHLSLLVDMMTHNGDITSIDRHGLSKLESDPCAKASFEQTMDHFINAAIFNEKDTMKSISSNIMLGKVIPGGTGCFDLMLDTNKLENSEYTSDETGGRITFTPLEEDSILKDIITYGINQPTFFKPSV